MSSKPSQGAVIEEEDGTLRWVPTAVSSEDVSASSLPRMPTAQQFEDWERDSRAQGYAEGYAAGFAQGMQEAKEKIDENVAPLLQIVQQLVAPLKQMERDTETELMHLVVAVAQQLVRRELRCEPGEIIGVIRSCMEQLPIHAQQVSVHLHPEDAALVRERLSQASDNAEWTLREDPLISRGGCRVTTDRSLIDATVEAQLARLSASVLSRSREDD